MLGLFMLCMGGAPKINTDDGPLIEGGGVEFDSMEVNDQDFLSLLDEAGDETSLANEGSTTDSEGTDDDIFAELFATENSDNSASMDNSESGDDGMNEILRLLEMEDDSESGTTEEGLFDDAQYTEDTYGNSDNTEEEPLSTNETGNQPTEEINNLNGEVGQLETLLDEKTTEMENLQIAINEFDQKIADMESKVYGGTSNSQSSNIQPAGYYETSSGEESGSEEYYSEQTNNISAGEFGSAYNYGFELFQGHQYQEAIAQFRQLLEMNSRHSLSDNCQYWIGECQYAQGNYYQAVVEFTKVSAFDSPDKQDDAQLMLGLAFMKLGETSEARSELDWLVSCYASSEYINRAHQYLGQL